MNEPSSIERRITLRLLAYWEKLRGDRSMPAVSDINSKDIEDLWCECFMIEVGDPATKDYKYLYLGEEIVKAYCCDLADNEAHGLVSPNAVKLAQCYAQVIISGKPMLDEGEFSNSNGEIIKYRQCMLPLGEGERVTAIFGGMRYKAFPV